MYAGEITYFKEVPLYVMYVLLVLRYTSGIQTLLLRIGFTEVTVLIVFFYYFYTLNK